MTRAKRNLSFILMGVILLAFLYVFGKPFKGPTYKLIK